VREAHSGTPFVRPSARSFRISGQIRSGPGSVMPHDQGGGTSAHPRPPDFMADATVPLVEGAAALVLGTGFFGFLVSRFPRFLSVAMISILDTRGRFDTDSHPSDVGWSPSTRIAVAKVRSIPLPAAWRPRRRGP
jgi:hypothetical protein